MFKSATKSKFYISIIFYLDSGASDFAEVSKFWTGLHRPSGDLDWVGSVFPVSGFPPEGLGNLETEPKIVQNWSGTAPKPIPNRHQTFVPLLSEFLSILVPQTSTKHHQTRLPAQRWHSRRSLEAPKGSKSAKKPEIWFSSTGWVDRRCELMTV